MATELILEDVALITKEGLKAFAEAFEEAKATGLLHVGTTAPINPPVGKVWADVANMKIKSYGEDGEWHDYTSGGGSSSDSVFTVNSDGYAVLEVE